MATNVVPIWDYGEVMTLDALYGGIFIGTSAAVSGVTGTANPTGFPELYDNAVFRVPLHAANAMISRIRQWTFAGAATMYLNGDTDFPVWSGSWSVTLKASRYWFLGNIELVNEDDLCRFGGWHGVGNVTGTPTGEDPISSDMDMWFGTAWFRPGFADENGVVNASGQREVTFHEPVISGADLGVPYGFSFGKFVTDIDGHDIDNCPVVATLPITRNGSFDATGITGFHLELGGSTDGSPTPGSSANIVGSATLNPTLWWSHGGRWETATGARL